jgi:cell division protein FtsZ
VLINVSGGEDMSLHEVSEAARIIQEAADPDANIIFGTVIDPRQQNSVKVTVVATGFMRDGASPMIELPRENVVESEFAPPSQPAPVEMPQPEEQQPQGQRFFRAGAGGEMLDFDANDDGFTPNFGKMKDDLDVPAFLRKQMD